VIFFVNKSCLFERSQEILLLLTIPGSSVIVCPTVIKHKSSGIKLCTCRLTDF